MAFNTDRIRKAAVKVSAWLSRTDAPMAEDSSSNAFRFGPISDESDNRPASAFDRVYLLRISRDAVNGWLRDAPTRDATRVLYFLSLVIERPQRVLVRCLSLYVCVPWI